MRLIHAARTDVGMKRENNEDSLLAFPEQAVFAVFDGLGGYAAGEVASGIAVRETREFFELTGRDPEATWPFKDDRSQTYDANRLVTAIKLSNARILEAAEADRAKKNMGSTAAAVHFVEREGRPLAWVAHAGDSRVYLLRSGRLSRVTTDHSLVEEYLRLGKLTEEEARTFPQKNIILRALGQNPYLEIEVQALELHPGDLLLLCTDGLSGMVEDPELESLLAGASGGPLDPLCEELIDTANRNGGTDNITAVLVRYEGP